MSMTASSALESGSVRARLGSFGHSIDFWGAAFGPGLGANSCLGAFACDGGPSVEGGVSVDGGG